MNLNPNKFLIAALALCFLPGSGRTQLQSVHLAAPANKLSSVTYFDSPDDQKVKLRMSGSEMVPLPGATFDVKQLMVEQFNTAGRLQAVVEAPQCFYTLDGVANSSGHLQLRLHGDQIHVEGDGFVWRQSDNSILISNNVSTMIKTGTWKLTTP